MKHLGHTGNLLSVHHRLPCIDDMVFRHAHASQSTSDTILLPLSRPHILHAVVCYKHCFAVLLSYFFFFVSENGTVAFLQLGKSAPVLLNYRNDKE